MDRIETIRDYALSITPGTGDIRVRGAKLLIDAHRNVTIIESTSEIVYPGDDLTPQPESVQKMAKAFWTQELIKQGRARRTKEHDGSAIHTLADKARKADLKAK